MLPHPLGRDSVMVTPQTDTTDSDDTDAEDEPCMKCHDPEDGTGGRQMLLCDSPVCDNAAHLECLGLQSVPDGDWYCCAVCQRAAGALTRLTCMRAAADAL